MISQIDLDLFDCSKIDSKVFQLGLILFPLENVNERFLLKLRNCIVELDKAHVLKRWIIQASNPVKSNAKQFESISNILTTKFNLITDSQQKSEIVDFLKKIKGESILDKILKSYLYLILGNVAESNNQLKAIYTERPSQLYRNQKSNSLHVQAALKHLDDILKKIASHPSDRIHFNILTMYLKNFFNDKQSIEFINDHSTDLSSSLLRSGYVKNHSPDFMAYINRSAANYDRLDSDFLFYWLLPFHEINVSKNKIISIIEYGIKNDYLWSVYAINSERMIDIAIKEFSNFSVNNRRKFLRKELKNQASRNLAIYKLIEMGDIDEALIDSVLESYHE